SSRFARVECRLDLPHVPQSRPGYQRSRRVHAPPDWRLAESKDKPCPQKSKSERRCCGGSLATRQYRDRLNREIVSMRSPIRTLRDRKAQSDIRGHNGLNVSKSKRLLTPC